jgi:hypothetical protein
MVRYPMLARQVETEELADMWIQEWADGLKGVNPKNIKTGLEEDLNRASDFPPSIGVFIKLCSSKSRSGMYKIRKITYKKERVKPDFSEIKKRLR